MPRRRSAQILSAVFLAVTVACTNVGQRALLDEVPPELQKTVACMSDNLKTIPGVDDVTVGVMGQARPFIQYRAPSDGGYTQLIRFVLIGQIQEKSGHQTYEFGAGLPGLSEVGKEPNNWGTPAVIKKWKDECGVHASALFN